VQDDFGSEVVSGMDHATGECAVRIGIDNLSMTQCILFSWNACPRTPELYCNQLSGGVPDGFWSLSQLTFLEMQDNRLEGSVSPAISRGRGLTAISISGDEFAGRIPANIYELHELLVIDVVEKSGSGFVDFRLK
jgi:hypothetical protein